MDLISDDEDFEFGALEEENHRKPREVKFNTKVVNQKFQIKCCLNSVGQPICLLPHVADCFVMGNIRIFNVHYSI
jgi:hypothetical protein